MMNITWNYKPFNELTPHELYAILRLRSEVFVIEQQCLYLDADNKDQCSMHLMGWQEDHLAAYARLVPAGVSNKEPSIGRIVVSPAYRGRKAGQQLVQTSITTVYNIWGQTDITIGAQLYLKKFYESFGFQQISDTYLDDGIEHITMLMPFAP